MLQNMLFGIKVPSEYWKLQIQWFGNDRFVKTKSLFWLKSAVFSGYWKLQI